MPKISAVIITLNEEKLIERCLTSLVGVADEIIVVDSFSTDSTEKICAGFNVKFHRHVFTGFMDQKNYALSLALNNYILSLDADEALNDELRKSILAEKDDLKLDGYYFNRLNNFCGQWIRHSAWYPDRQLRLFNRRKGTWGPINVHETFNMLPGSTTGRLKGDILHWAHESAEELAGKINSYSDIAAGDYFKAGKKVLLFSPVLHLIWRFIVTYFFHLGFLDGKNGLIVCYLGAWSSYLKYSKLRKLSMEANKKKG
ncbi:MAG: glycosyltransferase family 2 protein [Bacteroidales bacterium]|jgi:glycosyltransferase involved in cell wall biosynthesis|nr:glycosyltransferase family 2 protein [Bacteroidales bacterium]